MSSGNSQEGSPECKSPLLTHPRATRGSKPRPGDIQLLKFSVVSTDGGQYSSNYKCENFLSPDSKVRTSLFQLFLHGSVHVLIVCVGEFHTVTEWVSVLSVVERTAVPLCTH